MYAFTPGRHQSSGHFVSQTDDPTLEVPVAQGSEILGCRLSHVEAQLVREYAADRDVFIAQVIREALAREVGFSISDSSTNTP